MTIRTIEINKPSAEAIKETAAELVRIKSDDKTP